MFFPHDIRSSGILSLVLTGILYWTSFTGSAQPYPHLRVTISGPLPEVNYLLATEGWLTVTGPDGDPCYFRFFPKGVRTFMRHPSGDLTCYDVGVGAFLVMDPEYRIHDTLRWPGGNPDFHSLQILPDGRVLMMAEDTRRVDMSAVVEGGDPQATVQGLLLRVQDASGNPVFSWSSWDHFSVTDADTALVDLTAAVIDYVHANRFVITPDGNYLLTSRNMSEITKIDASTGEIIWRMGGKHNQFTGDTIDFRAIHDAHFIGKDTLILFDNGLPGTDPSSIKIYRVNQTEHRVRLLHSLPHPQGLFTPVMGSVARMQKGRLLAGWGKNSEGILFSVMDTTGSLYLDVGSVPGEALWTYQVSCTTEQDSLVIVDPDTLVFVSSTDSDTLFQVVSLWNLSEDTLLMTSAKVEGKGFRVNATEATLFPGDTLFLQVSFIPPTTGTFMAVLRLTFQPRREDQIYILRKVLLQAEVVTRSPAVETALYGRLYPNPCHGRCSILLPDERPAELRVTTLEGRMVMLRHHPGGSLARLDLSFLNPGIYFIFVEDKRHHKRKTLKVVLQK